MAPLHTNSHAGLVFKTQVSQIKSAHVITLPHFAGNITPYVTSYLRNMTDDTYVDYTDTFWISQSTSITGCVCMPFIGVLANRLPTKLYLLIGAVFNV